MVCLGEVMAMKGALTMMMTARLSQMDLMQVTREVVDGQLCMALPLPSCGKMATVWEELA
jgi:hypothetical protein